MVATPCKCTELPKASVTYVLWPDTQPPSFADEEIRPNEKKGFAWGHTGAAQTHRHSCGRGLEGHPHTAWGFHSLCTSCKSDKLSQDKLDGPLHLWRALPVRKFLFQFEGNLGQEAGCPRFLPLAFSSTNCSFLVCSQVGCPSNAWVEHFANKNKNLTLNKPEAGPSQASGLSLSPL